MEKRIENILAMLKYDQHEEKMLLTILSNYPSLCDTIEKCKEEGKKISIGYEHGIAEPVIVNTNDGLYLFLNN